jgi:FkbM family methyltransferase
MKIASQTRKLDRYNNPIAYRIARWLLKRIYPVQPKHRSLQIAAEYEKGMMNIDTCYAAEREILFYGSVEPGISALIKKTVKQGDVCIDIGANIGALTLLMAFQTGPEGRVIAVEPHPQILQRLQNNVDLNQLHHVNIIPAAVSNTAGKTILFSKPGDHFHQGASSLRQSKELTHRNEIQTITGAALEEKVGTRKCKFVKIDVEGHDFIVLNEIRNLIERSKPVIVFEYVKNRWLETNSRIEDALSLLTACNYIFYTMRYNLLFPLINGVKSDCDVVCIPKLNLLTSAID